MVVAGGFSRRFGQDKGLVRLAGKPLIVHVLDRVSRVVDEVVVVVSSASQKDALADLLIEGAKVVMENGELHGPLVGALTGFKTVQGEYSLLLPCDTPFVSSDVASFLLDLCAGRSAVIPRWPNGYIEPLQAVYHTKSALAAGRKALNEGKLDLRSMIAFLGRVRYVSTMVLQQLDPNLLTFFNINTVGDLRRAESMLR